MAAVVWLNNFFCSEWFNCIRFVGDVVNNDGQMLNSSELRQKYGENNFIIYIIWIPIYPFNTKILFKSQKFKRDKHLAFTKPSYIEEDKIRTKWNFDLSAIIL